MLTLITRLFGKGRKPRPRLVIRPGVGRRPSAFTAYTIDDILDYNLRVGRLEWSW